MASILIPEKEQNVEAFCENLKKSMLSALREGRKVCVKLKSDTEPVYAGVYSAITGVPVDFVYYGQTIAICFDRPAAFAISKHQANMLGKGLPGVPYPGEPQPDAVVEGK